MLPATIRYQVENKTGVAFAATDTLTLTAKHLVLTTATGVLAFSAESTPLAAASGNSLAANAFATSATIDTTTSATTAYVQGDLTLVASISTATPNGNLNVYMQESTDGGTSWPANGKGQLIGVMVCTAVGAQGKVQAAAR